MAAPQMATIHQFGSLISELRLMIWREAVPECGTVPVARIMENFAPDSINLTIPSTTPVRVTWALNALPRGQWPPEFKVRVRIMRSLYNANFEAHQAVIKQIPDVLGSEGGPYASVLPTT